MEYNILKKQDIELYNILKQEDLRQKNTLELIASENFTSLAVREAYTSSLTNKYAEGYPGKRYYGGCDPSDNVENLAIERAKKLFNVDYVNVQPHSGAQANMAVFLSILEPHDTFLGMDLAHGGHLTHGSKVNFSGLYYNVISYGVDKTTYLIDYNQVYQLAMKHKPKVIIAGASAYPRAIDFAKFADIAEESGAYLMVDMAHIAGLVATGHHMSPIPYANFVTSTTHKTLRGPRGGIILSNDENFFKKLNSRVFPGVQGGPLMHVIAAKSTAFKEALEPQFKEYQQQVILNAQVLSESLLQNDIEVITKGTDNHMVLINTYAKHKVTGKDAQNLLEEVGITTNKNAIPFDENPPAVASGIRVGSAALTTRGLKQDEFNKIGNYIAEVIHKPNDKKAHEKIKHEVTQLTQKFSMEGY